MSQFNRQFAYDRHAVSVMFERAPGSADINVTATMGRTIAIAACSIARSSDHQITIDLALTERGYAAGSMSRHAEERDDDRSPDDQRRAMLLKALLACTLPKTFARIVKLDLRIIARDEEVDPIIAAFLAATSAISIASGLKVKPAALCRLGLIEGEFVLNPPAPQMKMSRMDLWVCASGDRLLHVRGHGLEVSETTLVKGISFCQKALSSLSGELYSSIAAAHPDSVANHSVAPQSPLQRRVRSLAKAGIFETLGITDQAQQRVRLNRLRKAVQIAMCVTDDAEDRLDEVGRSFDFLVQSVIRERCLGGHMRADQRESAEMRPRILSTGVLPITHGSADHLLGEQRTLAIATLGIDKAPLDRSSCFRQQRFGVHVYPQPKARNADAKEPQQACVETGHWITDALRPVMPTAEIFPYATRVDIEQMGSQPSSADQALAAATHALLDAGVPMRASVAAIEIGLLRSPSHFMTLSDVVVNERAACDLVATLAGTQSGLTGIDLNSNCSAVSIDMLEVMLRQARETRLSLLEQMNQTLAHPRDLSDRAPRVQVLHISARKTGLLLGRGGRTVKAICRDTNSHVEVFSDGTVRVSASSDNDLQSALLAIHEVLRPLKPGQLYEGRVVEIEDRAVLVRLNPGREGILPQEEMLAPDTSVEDQFSVGDRVRVVCQSIDTRGSARLSMKALYELPDDDGGRICSCEHEGATFRNFQ
ncbi:S1 RNA-binding domain-containing protein [Stutzerimonas kunmingensis]|uniref:S1 RNA-binding domain-containing protein n=1 Tax=Stutzerimonas kunmingensis TaxID=1211807 RepID=UPI0005B432C0|nr:S1 RNA-binding domain-containing protein [Stutzerimonas kunmingensis]